jgi:GDP-D-mannose 3',5'-epimerase
MYISDCLFGTKQIAASDIMEPINLGSAELVTVDELVDIVESIAGIRVKRSYNLDAPLGVRGRNSDNTLIQKYLNWEPSVSLQTGMERTFAWIYDQMKSGRRAIG